MALLVAVSALARASAARARYWATKSVRIDAIVLLPAAEIERAAEQGDVGGPREEQSSAGCGWLLHWRINSRRAAWFLTWPRNWPNGLGWWWQGPEMGRAAPVWKKGGPLREEGLGNPARVVKQI